MKILKVLVILSAFALCTNCKEKVTTKEKQEVSQMDKAQEQFALLLAEAEKANRIPRTISKEGFMEWTKESADWTEGFFPGSCWYLYEYTKDQKWRLAAEKFQALFENHKYKTTTHDLGFIFNCSFGNGYRLTENEAFKQVMITAGDSLITRFNPTIGCIKSWDVKNHGWISQRGWKFPVIIDNMMNLELLFKLSEFTGNAKYREIAITHANTTLKNHFRDDNSSYHVLDYDPDTGEIRSKETGQGFANESAWARGQAWGLYGYTVCYRYTKDTKYLQQAQKIAEFIINNKNLPEDGIPYWDFDTDKIPEAPRDVSAATIAVSALIELDGYSENSYRSTIDNILNSLTSEKYTAALGENKNFILKHSVGNLPQGVEVDVPLNYADYYYLEALTRYQKFYQK